MSEQPTNVEHADNVNVEAPAAAEQSEQGGADSGQETPSGLVAEDTKVEQGEA